MLLLTARVALSLLLAASSATPFLLDRDLPTVTIRQGRLRGKHLETRDGRRISGFLGVPFAKPPVGPLRFEPPQPADPWLGTRLAVLQPHACVQRPDPLSSEDCLYLNVFSPNLMARPLLPVIVWIYGGSFEIGAAYGYTPEYYLDHDVVLVVIQYRLGLFGFFSTGDEHVPGNMGLKDQRMALRWVRDNIAQFGGDPKRVTVAGESAGSVSVHYLMLFASDLFQGGISESATALQCWAFRPPVEVKKMVSLLAKLAECPEESAALKMCLQRKSAVEIRDLYSRKYKKVVYDSMESHLLVPLLGAVLEPECSPDRLVTANPWEVNNTLPWLLGVNSKECLLFLIGYIDDRTGLLFQRFDREFNHYFPLTINYQNSEAEGSQVPLAARDFYLSNQTIGMTTLSSTVDMLSDPFYIFPTHAAALKSRQDHVYVYLFDHLTTNSFAVVPAKDRMGASHFDELFMFFPHPGLPVNVFWNSEEPALSRQLVKMWVDFATFLNPTPEGSSVVWPPYSQNRSYLHIGQAEVSVRAPFLQERMQFWESVPYPNRDDNITPPQCSSTE